MAALGDKMRDPVLVTGAAGFIGFHMTERLLSQGRRVIGLDIVNSYYDPRLKESRLEILTRHSNFAFTKLDLTDRTAIKLLFEQHRFPAVVHLAAQAGVRYSLDHPHAYVDANLEVLSTFWKAATTAANISYSHPRRRSMAQTRNCRSRCGTTSITRSASMPRRKRPTN
jgi:nucleoside-diphosphate-sugar epimerase